MYKKNYEEVLIFIISIRNDKFLNMNSFLEDIRKGRVNKKEITNVAYYIDDMENTTSFIVSIRCEFWADAFTDFESCVMSKMILKLSSDLYSIRIFYKDKDYINFNCYMKMVKGYNKKGRKGHKNFTVLYRETK